MTKQIINIDDNTHVAIMGRDGKAEKIIIGSDINEVFLETRVKDRVSKILYEDNIFKTYGKKEDDV